MPNKRLYSLFTKDPTASRYTRLSPLALPKPQAVRIFQNLLLAGSMNGHAMYLRPVTAEDLVHSPEYRQKLTNLIGGVS